MSDWFYPFVFKFSFSFFTGPVVIDWSDFWPIWSKTVLCSKSRPIVPRKTKSVSLYYTKWQPFAPSRRNVRANPWRHYAWNRESPWSKPNPRAEFPRDERTVSRQRRTGRRGRLWRTGAIMELRPWWLGIQVMRIPTEEIRRLGQRRWWSTLTEWRKRRRVRRRRRLYSDWSFQQPIDWLIERLIDWLIDRLILDTKFLVLPEFDFNL